MKNLCKIECILESWKRCIGNGLDPNIKSFQKYNQNVEGILKNYQNIIQVFNQLVDNISSYILEEHYFLLCSNEGVIIAQNNKKKLIF